MTNDDSVARMAARLERVAATFSDLGMQMEAWRVLMIEDPEAYSAAVDLLRP